MSGVLGCASDYGLRIHYRGGAQLYAELPRPTALTFGRRLDDVSTADITLAKPALDRACCGALARVDAFAHELTIYRDGTLVWQGPIVQVVEAQATITISARDVVAYLDKRANWTTWDFTGSRAQDVARVANYIVRDALTPDDPGIVPWLVTRDAGVLAEAKADERETVLIGDELRELARTGLDFTTVGRKLLLFGELRPIAGRVAVLTAQHVLGDIEIIRPGLDYANRVVVDTGGPTGIAGQPDDTYGLLHRVVEASDVQDAVTAGQMATAVWRSTRPPWTVIRLPQDAALSSAAPISFHELVCGARVDVHPSGEYCLPVSPAMRIARVTVEWDQRVGERITAALLPLGLSEEPPA